MDIEMESREDLIKFNISIMPDYAKLKPLPSKEFIYDLIQKKLVRTLFGQAVIMYY